MMKPVKRDEGVVTDKEGRRRFHGAFTGGFSAGYYNTCGTKEGWQPGTFSSSADKKDTRRQRPEDFMDDEDDPMLGRQLLLRGLYSNPNSKDQSSTSKSNKDNTISQSIVPGNQISELITCTPPTVGRLLLQQMGWKEGQGVGPARQRSDMRFAGESILAETHHFAPTNLSEEITVVAKNDAYGLGFLVKGKRGLQSLSDNNSRLHLSRGWGVNTGHETTISKRYNQGDSSLSTLYDFELSEDNASKKRSTFGSRSNLTDAADDAYGVFSVAGLPSLESNRCDDGSLVLPKFCLGKSSSKTLHCKYWDPPPPPKNFIAKHKFKEKLVVGSYDTTFSNSSDKLNQPSNSKLISSTSRQSLSLPPPPPPMGSSETAIILEKFRAPTIVPSTVKGHHVSEKNQVISETVPSTSENSQNVQSSNSNSAGHVQVNIASALSSRFSLPGQSKTGNSNKVSMESSSGHSEATASTIQSKTHSIVQRSESSWVPTRLLCKRFHVPPPPDWIGCATSTRMSENKSDVDSLKSWETINSCVNISKHSNKNANKSVHKSVQMSTTNLRNIDMKNVRVSSHHHRNAIGKNKILVYPPPVRPHASVFKAIFESSGDEQETKSNLERVKSKESNSALTIISMDKPILENSNANDSITIGQQLSEKQKNPIVSQNILTRNDFKSSYKNISIIKSPKYTSKSIKEDISSDSDSGTSDSYRKSKKRRKHKKKSSKKKKKHKKKLKKKRKKL